MSEKKLSERMADHPGALRAFAAEVRALESSRDRMAEAACNCGLAKWLADLNRDAGRLHSSSCAVVRASASPTPPAPDATKAKTCPDCGHANHDDPVVGDRGICEDPLCAKCGVMAQPKGESDAVECSQCEAEIESDRYCWDCWVAPWRLVAELVKAIDPDLAAKLDEDESDSSKVVAEAVKRVQGKPDATKALVEALEDSNGLLLALSRECGDAADQIAGQISDNRAALSLARGAK